MTNNAATSLGRTLAQTNNNIYEVKEFGFGNQLSGFYQLNPYDSVEILSDRIVLTKQLIGSAMILGHPVNGRMGMTYTLGDGDLGSSSEFFIAHSGNTYIERFGSNIMTDTDLTTATVNTSDYELNFSSNPVEWYSKRIFYDSTGNTTKDSLVVTNVGTSTDALSISATLDGGTTWNNIEFNKTYKWNTPGSDIRIKISNDEGIDEWPTPWNTWGGMDGAQSTLTEIKVIYGTGFGTNIIS